MTTILLPDGTEIVPANITHFEPKPGYMTYDSERYHQYHENWMNACEQNTDRQLALKFSAPKQKFWESHNVFKDRYNKWLATIPAELPVPQMPSETKWIPESVDIYFGEVCIHVPCEGPKDQADFIEKIRAAIADTKKG